MSIITSGGGIDRTHGAETPDDQAMLAAAGAGDLDATRRAAAELLNQPATLTPKAQAAFEAAAKALATGLLDPVVSDRDTKKVLDALEPLATREWLAVVNKMKATSAPEGSLFERFTQRGLADDARSVERFLRQILDKFGTRDSAGGVSIPTDLLTAIGKELGAPGRDREDLSTAGRIQKDVGDTAALAYFLLACLTGRR